jgi:hypothetical protein
MQEHVNGKEQFYAPSFRMDTQTLKYFTICSRTDTFSCASCKARFQNIIHYWVQDMPFGSHSPRTTSAGSPASRFFHPGKAKNPPLRVFCFPGSASSGEDHPKTQGAHRAPEQRARRNQRRCHNHFGDMEGGA